MAYGADGKILASGSKDHTVKLWDSVSGEEFATLQGRESGGYQRGRRTGRPNPRQHGRDGSVKLWDVKD